MACAKCDLLRFWEELIHCAIENEFANRLEGDQFFWPDLGSIQNVEVKVMFASVFDYLDRESPFRRTAIVDCLV